MSSQSSLAVLPGGFHIPPGIELNSITLGLFEIFDKTKQGKIEETELALRFKTKLVVDKKTVTCYDNVEYLISRCQSIMAENPKEQASCTPLIKACEEMRRIAEEPVAWNVDFMGFAIEIRNRIYEMAIGEAKSIIHHCSNACYNLVSCPAGYCTPNSNDLGKRDLKEALALAQTCKKVNAEILKLLYQNNVLHFSCTCSLAFCLSRSEFVRQNVQRLKLHLRGPQFVPAVSLLRICPKLKQLEVTVSKWSTFYIHKSNSPFDKNPRLAAARIDPPLQTARGAAELLEIQFLESVKVSNAAVDKMLQRDVREVKNFEIYLKERLEGRGLLKVNNPDLNGWLDSKMKLGMQQIPR
ncbi:hypothetical protein N431DRAFT_460329 [Stipitochalara longipes BDJ]|nr:hypothetical protein N431DRAFT_460329 [Stipitochalara longipes BDJ]